MGSLATVRKVLASTVPNNGTVSLLYPPGTSRMNFRAYSGSEVYVGELGPFTREKNQVDIEFNENDVLLTNRTGENWPVYSRLLMSFGRSDDRGTYTDLINYKAIASAAEWADNPEDQPVSIDAGGDGETTFSAKTWAARSRRERDNAQEWAQNGDDEPVSAAAGGDGETTFSAKAWASRAIESVDHAEEWANKPEDSPVSPAAGGDGSTTFSAKHYAIKLGKVPTFESRAAVATSFVLSDAKSLVTRGYATAGDGGAATYKRVASQPTHAGKVQSADGAWWEMTARTVRPEMFGAFGFDVGATPVNEAPALQAMLSFAMFYGCDVEFHGDGGRRKFGIAVPLVANPVIAPAVLGDLNTVGDAPMLAHFCNHPELTIRGVGNCEIIALSAMTRMLYLQYDHAISGSFEPIWSRIDGLKLNGNGLAERGLEGRYCYRLTVERCRIRSVARAIYLDHVGVSDITKCYLFGTAACIDGVVSGDNQIHDNEFQVQTDGIRLGGGANTKIYANTFTALRLGTNTSTGIRLMSDPAAETFNGTRDIVIFANEFFDHDFDIYGRDVDATSQKDIFKIKIRDNHRVRGLAKPNGRFLYLETARSVILSGNTIGDKTLEAEKTDGTADITLINVQDFSIESGVHARSTTSAILLSNCQNGRISIATANMARDTTNNPAVIDMYNGCKNIVTSGCTVNNTVACSNTFAAEHDTCDFNVFGPDALPASITTPYLVFGANTRYASPSGTMLIKPRTTGSLPLASSVPPGSMQWITNGSQQTAGGTKQPVWSDGAAWRYANGVAV